MKLRQKTLSQLRHIQTFGKSMFPILMDKDIITIRKVPFHKLMVDDVITFQKKNQLISHRIIYKTKKYIITKGDANALPDKKITQKDILGKVIQVKRNGQMFDPSHIYLYQSTTYMKEIQFIVSLLQKNTIDFVILKGLPLHLYYTHSFPKRLYADCDILIKNNDKKKCQQILENEGYEMQESHNAILPKTWATYAPEFEMKKKINAITISFDIHTEVCFLIKQFGDMSALYPQSLLNKLTTHFLKNKKHIIFNQIHFPILKKEDLALYLMLHLFSHNLKGYNRYELLNILLMTPHLNFKIIEKNIKYFRLENFIFPVIVLIKKFYPAKIPLSFMQNISPKNHIKRYIKSMILNTNIFSEEQKIHRGKEKFQHLFYLSPQPVWVKITIFLKPHILYTIFYVLFLTTESRLRKFFHNHFFL